MQVMGAAARERGFKANYITSLIRDPFLGIEYGIRHLWRYAFQLGNRKTVDALNRYNGGGAVTSGVYAGAVLSKKRSSMSLPEREYLKRLVEKRVRKLTAFLNGKGKNLRPFQRRYYERKLAQWRERASITQGWTDDNRT